MDRIKDTNKVSKKSFNFNFQLQHCFTVFTMLKKIKERKKKLLLIDEIKHHRMEMIFSSIYIFSHASPTIFRK